MNKLIKSYIFIVGFIVTFALTITISLDGIALASSNDKDIKRYEPKIYCDLDINDDFDDDSVIVVLDKSISEINREHKLEFFGDFEKKGIEDLTYKYNSKIRNTDNDKEKFNQIIKIELPIKSKQNVVSAIKKLEKIDGIVSAEPDYYSDIKKLPSISNGNRYIGQWGLRGDNGIQAEDAWDITTGSSSVKVAVIDTGISNHEDLNDNLESGYDFHNQSYVTNDDESGHGTQVAGIIGATGTNSNGIIGVAWDVEIFPVQAAHWDTINGKSDWYFSNTTVIESINWCADNDIDIINFSAGGYSYSNGIRVAISNYEGLFVCAAGNGNDNGIGLNADTNKHYPSDYSRGQTFSDRVISVGSLYLNGNASDFSNYGAESVSIFAPGESIVSTCPIGIDDSGYKYGDGTSMATPFVTGVAALVLSVNPNLTPREIKDIILYTTTKATNLQDKCVSGGRLNAYKAVLCAQSMLNTPYTATISNGYATITGIAESSILPIHAGIPSTINVDGVSYPVVEIGEGAFENQTALVSMVLPSSVTSIESNAFEGCTSLERLSYVSDYDYGSLTDRTQSYTNYYYQEVPLNVTLTPNTTYTLSFDYSGLTSSSALTDVFTSLGVGDNTFAIDLPVTKNFPNRASSSMTIVFTPTEAQLSTYNKLWCRFIRTSTPQTVSISISNIKLAKGITYMSINAFDNCPKLASEGLVFTLVDGEYSVDMGSATSQAIFIPSSYNDVAVTTIKASGFNSNDDIHWVYLQSSIATLGANAFENCSNLRLIDMDETSITEIGKETFSGCVNLKKVNFPSNLISIGEKAFMNVPIAVNLPDSVTTIGAYAFAEGENSVSFTLPTNLVSIGDYAFANKGNLVLIDNGTQLETIGEGAFKNTMLSSLETLPASVVTIGASAFENSEVYHTFAFADDNALTTIGANAFKNCAEISSIVLSSSVTTIGANAFSGCSDLTIYVEYASKPSGWNSSWNNSNRPVIWGCSLDYKAQVISFVKTSSNPTNYNNISDPTYDNMNFGGWYTTSNFTGDSYDYSDLSSAPNGTLYAKWSAQSSSCIAEGSLITLADGTQKAVEELTGEELLLVWNMETGEYDVAPILFIDVDSRASYEIIELTFADGTSVKVIYEHAFWDFTLNKYVFMREDASQYIGHYFNKQTYDSEGNMTYTAVELIEVDIYTELTIAYSPVTYGHLCYYVNGMLSMPGATEGIINIFEVTSMKYDEESYLEDVEEYGLFTYEEFNEIVELPEEVFNAFNGQYLKVALGKGLITWGRIIELLNRYSLFFEK